MLDQIEILLLRHIFNEEIKNFAVLTLLILLIESVKHIAQVSICDRMMSPFSSDSNSYPAAASQSVPFSINNSLWND